MSDISQKPLKPDQEYMKFLSQKTVLICFVLPGLFLLNFGCHQKQASEAVEFWLTNPDRSALFEKQSAPLSFGKSPGQQPIIDVDETQDFQTIDGFGFTLTGGSAMLINRMSATARAALLQELFDTDSNNIGVSYLRLSIGASDLDDRVFSYDDLPAGQADPELEKFSLEPDRQQLIPVQNEPLNPKNNPSLLMLPEEQAVFIKKNLGPAFQSVGIDTRIILYDHNADRPDYPITILNDLEARKYVDGSAFHLYGGKIEALSDVQKAHPDKNLYFTEQWIGAPGDLKGDMDWHVKNLIIGAIRNGCRTVLEWNLAADPQQKPHTVGGCDRCLGALTIDSNSVTRNPAYYIIASASKFVRPGSVRIASNLVSNLPNVAFRTPDGRRVLIVLNDSTVSQTFSVRFQGNIMTSGLPTGSVGTYVW
jgi:glucosylceramidase